MANSDQVLRGVSHVKDAEFHVLVPNEKGYDAACAGARVVSVFAAASADFTRQHQLLDCGVDRALPAGAGACQGRGVKVRGYISCVLAVRSTVRSRRRSPTSP